MSPSLNYPEKDTTVFILAPRKGWVCNSQILASRGANLSVVQTTADARVRCENPTESGRRYER